MKVFATLPIGILVLGFGQSAFSQGMVGAANAGSAANSSASSISNAIGSSQLAAGNAEMPGCAAQQCGCCPDAIMKIIQGLMGLAQGGANGDTADQHNGIADITNTGGGYSAGDASTTTDTPPTLDQVASFGQGKKVVDNLKNYGIGYKNGTFTLPNGTTISANDVGNQQVMQDKGVSPAEFAKNMSNIAALEKKLSAELTKSSGGSSFEGGGGSSSSPTRTEVADEVRAPAKVKDPAVSVAGMSKNFNGDMIGVSGDSLFIMMNRRYQQKVRDEGFLPPESAPH